MLCTLQVKVWQPHSCKVSEKKEQKDKDQGTRKECKSLVKQK